MTSLVGEDQPSLHTSRKLDRSFELRLRLGSKHSWRNIGLRFNAHVQHRKMTDYEPCFDVRHICGPVRRIPHGLHCYPWRSLKKRDAVCLQ